MRRLNDYLFYCLIFSIPVIFVLGALYYQGHHSVVTNTPKAPKPVTKQIAKPTNSVVAKKASANKVIITPQPQPTATPEPPKQAVSAPEGANPTPTVAQPQPTQELHSFDTTANHADTMNPGQTKKAERIVQGAVKIISSLLPL